MSKAPTLPSKILEGTAAGVAALLDRLTEETIMSVVGRIRRAEKEGLNSARCTLPHTFPNTGGAELGQVRQIVYGRTIEHIAACEDGFDVRLIEVEKLDGRISWELEVGWKPIIEIDDLTRCQEIVRSRLERHVEEGAAE